MDELRYTPKRKDKVPEWILTGCTCLMVAAVILRAFGVLPYQWVWETLFLLGAVGAVWVVTRYMTMSYTYAIEEEGRNFTVTQKQGRRLTCLCRLDLAALYRVRPYEEGDANAPRATRYAYCMTPSPRSSYLLFFRQEEKVVSIRIECEGVFLARLQEIAARVAAHEAEETDIDNIDETDAP